MSAMYREKNMNTKSGFNTYIEIKIELFVQ